MAVPRILLEQRQQQHQHLSRNRNLRLLLLHQRAPVQLMAQKRLLLLTGRMLLLLLLVARRRTRLLPDRAVYLANAKSCRIECFELENAFFRSNKTHRFSFVTMSHIFFDFMAKGFACVPLCARKRMPFLNSRCMSHVPLRAF